MKITLKRVGTSSTTIAKNPQARAVALERMAELTAFDIESRTVPELRTLLRTASITNLTVDGKTVDVSNARKADLTDALWEITKTTRLKNDVEESGLSPEDIAKALESDGALINVNVQKKIEEITERLVGYVNDLWDPHVGGWKMTGALPELLGSELWTWLAFYRGHTGDVISMGTRATYGSNIIKTVSRAISLEPVEERRLKLAEAYGAFRTGYYRLDKSNKTEVSKTAKVREVFRLDHVQEIDVGLMLERADKTLRAIASDKKPRWIDVSIALALVTGRRMSEIHATGSFKWVDDYSVEFKGQLKKAGETDSYVIPTLIEARFVVIGHEYLKMLDKYVVNEPKLAHSRYSKDISCRGMGLWYTECLPGLKNYTDEKGKTVSVRTYHRLREMYALTCVKVCGPKDPSAYQLIAFYKGILGHSEVGTQFLAYERNFKLVGGWDYLH